MSPPTNDREITVTTADLPLHCPRDDDPARSHPRVFLAIEPGGSVGCPYCGTRYHLPADEA